MTSGKKNIHSQYWKNLIGHIARKKSQDFIYSDHDDKFIFVGLLSKQCIDAKFRAKQLKVSQQNVSLKATSQRTASQQETSSLLENSNQQNQSKETRLQKKLVEKKRPTQNILLQSSKSARNEMCGYFWPDKAGWHQITIDSGKQAIDRQTAWRYIEPRSSWLAVQQSELISATMAKLSMNSIINASTPIVYYHQVNLWYFWWMFFMGASLIWLERKLD